MKLIIDIPEEDYKGICNLKNEQLQMLPEEVAETLVRISNGTPLDDVKTEFINSYPTNYIGEPELNGASCHFSLNKVLQILDNIGKADMRTNRKNYEYRHENGNCLKVGGFCTSVDDEHCMRNKIRCNTCKNNDDELSGECYECIKGIFDHYEPQESEDKE